MKHPAIGLLRSLTRHYPLATPRASILKLLPAIPAGYGEFAGKNGARFRGYDTTNDEVCRSLFWFGDFDPWVTDALTKLARRGSTAIDIGANIGATAIALARAVGPTGQVICFEPMPSNLEHLRQNIECNGLSQVRIEPIALSSSVGEISMHMADRAGQAHVAEDGTTRVPKTTFDTWLAQNPGLDISVCKIDVEGHELDVFIGMRKALQTRRLPALVFEHHGGSDAPLFSVLTGYGYKISQLRKGFDAPTSDYTATL